ncbi:hypothetical protein BDY19DRAFT_390677 [Irpex rosettiformis]|uniref:Uncharacterized protein n=1 Tax=Irpex rosettiformis TaxID=378272 RepID=A0ACB8TUT3_9APHY|nr:hypothetical protein BDY19DRAFT_390677 [Irpex rosettiformis]
MPPQPGVFALSYASSSKSRGQNGIVDNGDYHPSNLNAGPSRVHGGTPIEDSQKRKRKEFASKLGKEMSERREDVHYNSGRHYAEAIQELNLLAYHLSTRPDTVPAYQLRLYPITLERSALLSSMVLQERHALDLIQTAYDEERERVEDEWKKGRDRIKERLLEGIEERRRRAREEKEGEGTGAEGGLDSQSRPHITRKLRNKLGGTSPPPTPLASATPGTGVAMANGAITGGPFLNPHSLSVDELPSPFPLPLTSSHLSGGSGTNTTNKKKSKGGGKDTQNIGPPGKSLQVFSQTKEFEIEQDLGEIRRGNKRRRVAAGGGTNK